MKATKLFTIISMVLLMVSIPSQAQSRKERKAAEKAAWEARQQFIKDSTAIANQQRLDSIKNAPKVAAEKAAAEEQARKEAAVKAEAERRAAEEAARSDAKLKAEAKAQEWKDVVDPCEAFKSTSDLIRGKGNGSSESKRVAVAEAEGEARRYLQEQLMSVIGYIYRDKLDRWKKNGDEAISDRMNVSIRTYAFNVNSFFNVCCNKVRERTINGKTEYEAIVVVEVSREDAKRVAYEELQKFKKAENIEDEYSWNDFDADLDKAEMKVKEEQ